MKTILINGSPRKNWNTAQLLKSAQKGAESSGGETICYDLYDLNFTGCRSCLACKRKGNPSPCKCVWKDELSPVLEQIYEADRLILGTPIYYGEPTGMVRCRMERLCFPAMTYNDYTSVFHGKVDVDIFLTMNVTKERYASMYGQKFEAYFWPMHFLNGQTRLHPVFDTLQVQDYSKYEMASFDGDHKHAMRETQFPLDLEYAFRIGAE